MCRSFATVGISNFKHKWKSLKSLKSLKFEVKFEVKFEGKKFAYLCPSRCLPQASQDGDRDRPLVQSIPTRAQGGPVARVLLGLACTH